MLNLDERKFSSHSHVTHTVLLTSFSGAVECESFPGPIFGMSPGETRRDLAHLTRWLGWNYKYPADLFPATRP